MKKIKKEMIIATIIAFYFAFASTYSLNLANIISNIGFSILIIFLLFPIFYIILKKLKAFSIKTEESKVSKKEIILYFIITAIVFTLCFIALMGGSSPDTINQYNQALSNSYNDWHPVIHTLLFYKIPLLFTSNYNAVIIWQLFVLSILITIVCYSLRKIGLNKKATMFFLILFLINPSNIRMVTMPWKDIPYSFMILLLTIIMIFITKSKGEWLKSKKNLMLLGTVLFFTLAFRHNGIISFAFIILALIFLYQKYWKKTALLSIIVFSLFSIITGPIYKALNIPSHSSSFIEALGVPLNQISYVYNNGGEFSKEEWEFFNEFADVEVWKEKYSPRGFNDIKWAENGIDPEFLNNNKIEFLQFYISLIKRNMYLSINSYYHVTSPIWSIENNLEGTKFDNNRYGNTSKLIYKISDKLNNGLNIYENWLTNIGIKKIIFGYGGSLFIIVLSIAIISIKSKFYLKKYLAFVPALSNTLGIMLLITGGELRFVYSNVLCAIPLLLYSMSDISKKCEKDNDETLLKILFLKKTKNTALQFFRYIFVGGIAALVNIGSLFILTDFIGLHYIISSIIGFILGLIVNYILSKAFIFSTEQVSNKKKEFAIYSLIGIIGLIIDTLFMFIFTSILSIYYLLSKIISTLITFIWNFTARKIMYKMEEKNGKK